MQHAPLRDVMKAVDVFEQRTQAEAVPQLQHALFSQYVALLNVMLEGTGRSVSYNSETRLVTLNGGTASRGYGPVESIHAESITDILKTKLLDTWGLNKAEQSALRTIAEAVEAGARGGSGNMHTFALPEHVFEYTALTALQGILEIINARVEETQRLKHAVIPLKEAVASLMTRLDIQRGVPSSKGLKDIPFTQVANDDYQKIQAALNAKGITGEHAELHLGLILVDLVDASHEKVTFRKSEVVEEEEQDELQEIGEYRSIEDVESAALRYTEYIHDIIMRLEERSSVKMIGGFLVADLEREEESIRRLEASLRKKISNTALTGIQRKQLDGVEACIADALKRDSRDTSRFSKARSSIIAFRDIFSADSDATQKANELDFLEREKLLAPVRSFEEKIRLALAGADGSGAVSPRYTEEELALLGVARSMHADLRHVVLRVYPNAAVLSTVLKESAISDLDSFQKKIDALCLKIENVIKAPLLRKERAEQAFEYLARGVLETTTHHIIRFERIDNRITFHIPTPIASVVYDSRLVDQVHSGTYQSLAEAIRYANRALVVGTSQIVGLEERASESYIDDALTRMERLSRAREASHNPYRSLRSHVKRVVAALLGGTLGMTVQLPEPPRKEPTHDADTQRRPDRTPGVENDMTKERPASINGGVGSTGGVTVTIPRVGQMSERTLRIDVPQPSVFLPRTVPQELDAHAVHLKKVFSGPVSDHGTYTLLPLLRTYVAEKRTLTPDERKATDWFTHAFTRYVNELPEERIAQLVSNVRLPRGVIASTIPSKIQGVPVEINYAAILGDARFWQWFGAFYEKRKATSLAQPGLRGVALSIDTLTDKLKKDFKISE